MNPKDITIIKNDGGTISAGIAHSEDSRTTYYRFDAMGFGATEEEALNALKRALADAHAKVTECLP